MRWAVVAACAASLGCAPEDVVVATLGGGHHDAGALRKCRTEADCRDDEFCESESCNDSRGHCEHWPLDCDSTHEPVCGCDRITYWNDCLRSKQRVTASALGACVDNPLPCGGPNTCPPGASCARIYPSGGCATASGAGACWVLPKNCPPSPPDGSRFTLCGDTSSCVDGCTAIRSEQPYQRLTSSCP
jgi:hypothetical protein